MFLSLCGDRLLLMRVRAVPGPSASAGSSYSLSLLWLATASVPAPFETSHPAGRSARRAAPRAGTTRDRRRCPHPSEVQLGQARQQQQRQWYMTRSSRATCGADSSLK